MKQLIAAITKVLGLPRNLAALLASFALASTALAQTCVSPPSGLVSWWSGDQHPMDLVGTNHGTLKGGMGYAAGEVGPAFSFDGTNDFVEVPHSDALNPVAGQPFSIEGWIKPMTNDYMLIVHKGNDIGSAGGGRQYWMFLVRFDGTPRLEFVAEAASSIATDQMNSIASPVVGEWQHVAVVVDAFGGPASGYHFYLNGQDAGLRVETDHVVDSITTTEPLRIGAGRDRLEQIRSFFKGSIDELGIYSRALSASEIAAIYAASSAGKCKELAILSDLQPASQTRGVGGQAGFSLTASGTRGLSYQWRRNGTPVATTSTGSLTLTNLTLADAGNYDVVVSDATSLTITSQLAVLNLIDRQPRNGCLASLWPGEGNANDALGMNDGTLQGGVSFTNGIVGQAFSFGGAPGSVDLGKATGTADTLAFAAWVRVGQFPTIGQSYVAADFDATGSASHGSIAITADHHLHWYQSFTDTTHQGFAGQTALLANQWYHVAVVRDDTAKTVTLYLNGVPDGTTNYVAKSLAHSSVIASLAPPALSSVITSPARWTSSRSMTARCRPAKLPTFTTCAPCCPRRPPAPSSSRQRSPSPTLPAIRASRSTF